MVPFVQRLAISYQFFLGSAFNSADILLMSFLKQMLHYLRSSLPSISVPVIHIAVNPCSLLATSTTLILPSPPPSFVNVLLPKKWCVFCKFCFLWHRSSIWLFLCTNLSLNLLQEMQLHLSFLQQKFSAFQQIQLILT